MGLLFHFEVHFYRQDPWKVYAIARMHHGGPSPTRFFLLLPEPLEAMKASTAAIGKYHFFCLYLYFPPRVPIHLPHLLWERRYWRTTLQERGKARRALFSLSRVTEGMKETLGRLAAGREGRERPSSFPVNTIPEVSENKREHGTYRKTALEGNTGWGGNPIPEVPRTTSTVFPSSSSSAGWRQTATLTSTLQRTFDKMNPMASHSIHSSSSRNIEHAEERKKVGFAEGDGRHSSETQEGNISSTSGSTSSQRGEGATSVLTNVWSSLWNPT